MNIRENIKNFLYDQNYYIGIFENNIYIFNYNALPKFNDREISVKMDNFKVNITGKNLKITKMEEKELLINGTINNIGFSK